MSYGRDPHYIYACTARNDPVMRCPDEAHYHFDGAVVTRGCLAQFIASWLHRVSAHVHVSSDFSHKLRNSWPKDVPDDLDLLVEGCEIRSDLWKRR